MNNSGDTNPRSPEPAPEPKQPVSRQSIKYGKPAVEKGASGRRARLRHAARGSARH